ncbi:hypothetical protein EJ04DRAFT_294273 [Polyplosphaeria fusca]|uniref:Uncharacterized protein n=1 Tax=Polyplosphaeria fusca TaxID=682080 RepID=A0A9P4V7P2_9PLEO|nr:hypothetical protein EJ04DRAFT_294273 [Polyplosphaeria fusca]
MRGDQTFWPLRMEPLRAIRIPTLPPREGIAADRISSHPYRYGIQYPRPDPIAAILKPAATQQRSEFGIYCVVPKRCSMIVHAAIGRCSVDLPRYYAAADSAGQIFSIRRSFASTPSPRPSALRPACIRSRTRAVLAYLTVSPPFPTPLLGILRPYHTSLYLFSRRGVVPSE